MSPFCPRPLPGFLGSRPPPPSGTLRPTPPGSVALLMTLTFSISSTKGFSSSLISRTDRWLGAMAAPRLPRPQRSRRAPGENKQVSVRRAPLVPQSAPELRASSGSVSRSGSGMLAASRRGPRQNRLPGQPSDLPKASRVKPSPQAVFGDPRLKAWCPPTPANSALPPGPAAALGVSEPPPSQGKDRAPRSQRLCPRPPPSGACGRNEDFQTPLWVAPAFNKMRGVAGSGRGRRRK